MKILQKNPGLGAISRRIALFLFLALLGCNPSNPAEGQVSGTVHFQGETLKSDDKVFLTVVFFSQDGQQYAKMVGKDGKYALKVPTGPARVVVKGNPSIPLGLTAPGSSPPEMDETTKRLLKSLEKYKDPDRSGLSYTVQNTPQTYDIELK